MNTHKTALVIGFEPFNGDTVNPSQKIVDALHGEKIANHAIVGAVLPTAFVAAFAALMELLETHRPNLVLALGQAGGRAGISLERVAINLIDARVPDNAGDQPVDIAVIDDAPNAYFSTLPIKAMLRQLQMRGIPAAISNTAGTFVCNQIFFALAHLGATQYPKMRSGFVHVPYLTEQAKLHSDSAFMELQTMIEAARICLHVAITTKHDLHFAAGATH
ncbi:MAG: pyroglutamyl-peptidase I [Rudaea sp.]